MKSERRRVRRSPFAKRKRSPKVASMSAQEVTGNVWGVPWWSSGSGSGIVTAVAHV